MARRRTTEVPSRMFLYFPTSRFVAIILHDLRGNNLIQQSFVTFFVSFLTDVLRGSCFLPQQYSPARINVFARVLRTCYTYGRVVQYSQIDSISSTKSTNQSSWTDSVRVSKKVSFTACHSGKLLLPCASPKVILTSPMMSKVDNSSFVIRIP